MKTNQCKYSALLALMLLSGCAQVRIIPLDTDGKAKMDLQEGVRYFLPKPYLLVAEVPVDDVTQTQIEEMTLPSDKQGGKKTTTIKKGGGKASTTGNGGADGDGAAPAGSGDSPASSGNTSFAMFTKQYGIKLIYLPDYSRPMAMSESTGLIGTSQMKPVLQDGWMLTSLDASADAKVAETLTALASLISSVKGVGSAATGTSKDGGATESAKAQAENLGTKVSPNPILPPGLYEFVYEAGVLKDLKPVAYFCANKGPSKTPC